MTIIKKLFLVQLSVFQTPFRISYQVNFSDEFFYFNQIKCHAMDINNIVPFKRKKEMSLEKEKEFLIQQIFQKSVILFEAEKLCESLNFILENYINKLLISESAKILN